MRSSLKGLILIAGLLAGCRQPLTSPVVLGGGHGASGRAGAGSWSTSPTGAGGGAAPSGAGGSGSTPTPGTGATEGWSITDSGTFAGGAGGAPSCAALVALYDVAIGQAQRCSVGTDGQCGEIVRAHLSACGSCPTYVNAGLASRPAQVETEWEKQGCGQIADAGACLQAPCPTPTNNTCADVGDGTGKCSFVTSSAPRDAGRTADASASECANLATQYRAALAAAQRCSTDEQCAIPVPSALSPCPSCEAYVTDATALTALRDQWSQASCDTRVIQLCIDGLCARPTGVACVVGDGGQGSCTALYTPGAVLD
jgi:hypothetical protein